MSILTSRAKSGGEKDALQAATPELKKLGQTLDLMNSQQWTRPGQTGEDCCLPNDKNLNSTSEQKSLNDESKNDGGKSVQQQPQQMHNDNVASRLRKELSKLSPAEQIGKLFELQKSRVAVYKQFNKGLEDVLQSGNLTSYPHLTTSITASFAVISHSIRDIQALMEDHAAEENKGDADIGCVTNVVKFIKQLQEIEKEKLNLTAALHLEKIRERNERLDLESKREVSANESGNNDDGIGGDDRVLRLLKEGVNGLQGRIRDYVEQINDVLEELRYASHDLMG